MSTRRAVPVEVKFCGMTRAEDVAEAARLGASYVGVIFAGGPREVGVEQAARILEAAADAVKRVGVFANQAPHEIGAVAKRLALDVVQLHAEADPRRVTDVRGQFDGEVWAVVHANEASLPAGLAALFATADAVLVDSHVPGALGGTGIAVAWSAIAEPLQLARGGVGRLVLAGGLRPENVAVAIETLHPDVVDVSSGIEASPGRKDHARMRSFLEAVQGTQVSR
jgi:phosphoribosylanthranilate isomerase